MQEDKLKYISKMERSSSRMSSGLTGKIFYSDGFRN
jgi:hypothetical protein